MGGALRAFACALIAISLSVAAPASQISANTSAVTTPASELRVTLGRLLAEHAFLTMEEMRATSGQAPELRAAARAVEENSAEIQSAIGSIYGAPAGQRFGEIWRGHIAYLVDYAVATSKSDSAGGQQALTHLTLNGTELGALLASANPQITAAGLNALLGLHIDQLAAHTTKDYAAAYAKQREAYAHMFKTADVLALAIARQFPERFPGTDTGWSPAINLRIALGRLLGEHAFLAMQAMRAGTSGAPDLGAIAGALEANSAELEAAFTSVYGAGAGASFGRVWRSHIAYYVDYITGPSNGGPSKQKAREQLEQYAASFASFLADANPNLSRHEVEHLVAMHSASLLGQADAFAARDYEKTYQVVREAYAHMFKIGDGLASAIAEQFPKQFPATIPDTAADPFDRLREFGFVALLMLAIAVLIATTFRRGLPRT